MRESPVWRLAACGLLWLAIPQLAVGQTWTSTGAHAGLSGTSATLLADGRVLLAGGQDIASPVATAQIYDPVTGSLGPTGSMHQARTQHRAVHLHDGRVLVMGGSGAVSVSNSAELYDPIAGTWAITGSLTVARSDHTTTLLADGRVLVTGGGTGQSPSVTASAELYDPTTGVWTPTGSLATARFRHTATQLPDGRVLVAGGSDASLEIYDAHVGTWSVAAAPLSVARQRHTATLLRNGRILIVGGHDFSLGPSLSAELYDPATDTIAPAAALLDNRVSHSATLLPDGRVLVAGGSVSLASAASADLYDPVANTWTMAGTLSLERYNHAATLLPDGRVLVAGGTAAGPANAELEIFAYASPTGATTGSLPSGRHLHTAMLLDDGRVLVAGGQTTMGHSSATAIYTPATGTWAAGPAMQVARGQHTATRLADGRTLVVGGHGLASAELHDPATGAWTATGSLAQGRYGHTATLLRDGRVLVAGGACTGTGQDTCNPNGALRVSIRSAEIFDPALGTWTTTGALNVARYFHAATLLRDGRVLITGHSNGNALGAPLSSPAVEIYDPATGAWSLAGNLTTSRAQATATLLGDGRVLVAGGRLLNFNALATTEIYDPTTGASSPAGAMAFARVGHSAMRLPDGRVLVAAGGYSGVEVFDILTTTWASAGTLPSAPDSGQSTTLLTDGRVLMAGGFYGATPLALATTWDGGLGFQSAWRPQITSSPSTLTMGVALGLGGTGFAGPASADGSSASSPTNYPIVQVRHLDSQQTRVLPVGAAGWSDTSFASTASALADFPRGPVLVTVVSRGIPSVSRPMVLTAATTTTLTGGAFVAGVPRTVAFTVTGQPGDVPIGSVTVTVSDGTPGCTVLVTQGSCPITFATTGPRTLSSTYSGGGTLGGSSSAPTAVTVSGFASVTTITSVSSSSPAAGAPVTVTFSVSGLAGTALTGTVTVRNGATSCSATVADGQCTLAFQAAGPHALTATYDGDASNGASTSAPAPLTVGPRLYTLTDGATGAFFDAYVLVANPGAADAPITLTFLREDGVTTAVHAVVAPLHRFTQRVDDVAEVASASFATTVASDSGAPLLVERASYFDADYRAGHAAAAREGARTAWYFAEGSESAFFDTYLLIANAGTAAADVTVTYVLEGGPPVTRTYTVTPASRLTVATGLIPELADRAFGMRVISTLPIAAERAVYFGDGYTGGHAEGGIATLSTTWLFAEGATGPGFDAFLLLANPGTTPAAAIVTYRTATGAIVTRTHDVPAERRVTLAIATEDPALADATFWIDVQADQPIVAERAMYWTGGGARWTEGHVSAGATAAATRWGFAEGIVGGGLGFRTYLLVANPGATAVSVEVQFLPTDGSPITQTYTVGAGARVTVDVESAAPALRDVPFGMLVTATSSGAVVAERSIYWTHGGPHFTGGTNTRGIPQF